MTLNASMLARLVAVVAIAVGITATAVHMAREDKAGPQPSPPAASEPPRTDPLRETLRHCQQLGEAATRDADCLAAWDQNRRRFLTPTQGQ
jgi:conjugative transfer region protein TrbK